MMLEFRWAKLAALISAVLMSGISFEVQAADRGPVQVWFTGEPAEVSDKLANLCADRQAAVVEQDEHHVLCQREVSGAKGIFAQVLLGNSYSTSPQLNIRFALLRDRKSVRVQASQWIELQMAGGQTRRTPLNNREQEDQLLNLLVGLGADENAPMAQWLPPATPDQNPVPATAKP
ncbi:hypothetical protein [Sphingomonas echinoides]|uniref:Uncharacterized protein n=1 Tax=Sphingomonas echinoides TaxID=59803 RepID=A0ABU4PLF7_9SPHN|nr:hypothetical protein [Sphingomonas echinoides]MDX5984677.1 hypothetical protein [Sphingomonas echinoides]